jgi:hypothetical protein
MDESGVALGDGRLTVAVGRDVSTGAGDKVSAAVGRGVRVGVGVGVGVGRGVGARVGFGVGVGVAPATTETETESVSIPELQLAWSRDSAGHVYVPTGLPVTRTWNTTT